MCSGEHLNESCTNKTYGNDIIVKVRSELDLGSCLLRRPFHFELIALVSFLSGKKKTTHSAGTTF